MWNIPNPPSNWHRILQSTDYWLLPLLTSEPADATVEVSATAQSPDEKQTVFHQPRFKSKVWSLHSTELLNMYSWLLYIYFMLFYYYNYCSNGILGLVWARQILYHSSSWVLHTILNLMVFKQGHHKPAQLKKTCTHTYLHLSEELSGIALVKLWWLGAGIHRGT